MEELLLALVIWIGRQLAKAYRKVQSWVAGRREESESVRERGTRAGPAVATPAAPAPDPYRAQREAVTSQAARLREQNESLGRDLRATAESAALGRALRDEVAPWVEEASQSASRLPLGAAGAVGLERLAERLDQVERLHVAFTWVGAQRRRDSQRSLQAADRLAAALYGPLAQAVLTGAGSLASTPEPVAFRGQRNQVSLGLWGRTSLVPVLLAESYPSDPLHFAGIAHELGRDLLERAPGLRWELRSRLGLPDRYPVPFAFRGYFGTEEVYLPWGTWLEVCFGDLVGALLLGPAYGWALLATLGRPEQPSLAAQVSTTREGAFYAPSPPPHLRLVFVQGALITLGFEEDALGLARRWEELHGGGPLALYVPSRLQGYTAAPLGPFEQVAGRLAEVLLEEPFDALGGQGLAQMEGVAFSPSDRERAEALTERLASSDAVAESDPRLRLAAAILARARASAPPGRLARWLLASALPQASASETAPRQQPPVRLAPARDDEPRAALYRDALVLDAILNRRPFGEPLPARWRP